MTLTIICAWCGCLMGTKESEFSGAAEDSTTHSICPTCKVTVMAKFDDAFEERGLGSR